MTVELQQSDGTSLPLRDAEKSLLRPDMTLTEARKAMCDKLTSAGIQSVDADVQYLLTHIAGVDRAAFILKPDQSLGSVAEALNVALERRCAREPVTRIVGWREFYGRRFDITSGVLDPRPDTETVVEHVLEIIESRGLLDQPVRILDIGTGSGILIVTLLAELKAARGVAIDISQEALDVAAGNAAAHGLADRVEFIHGGVPGQFDGFDVVVSNPPYIPSIEINELMPEVTQHDPKLALDGGPDGLDIYREIAKSLGSSGAKPFLVLELGRGQLKAVERLFRNVQADVINTRLDLGGIPRSVAMEIHL